MARVKSLKTKLDLARGAIQGGGTSSGIHKALSIERCLPTGLPNVDIFSGIDQNGVFGIPTGSIVTITGNPSQGKTTFTLNIARCAQDGFGREPFVVVHQDMEGMLTKEYIESQGVDTSKVLYHDAENLEDAFDAAINVLRTAKKEKFSALIILDSLSASPTKNEMDLDSLGDFSMPGTHAKVTARAFRVMTNLLKASGSIYVAVAQNKSSIGTYAPSTFIAEKPLTFHSSLVYQVVRTGWLTRSARKVGFKCKIVVKKNKIGTPMRETSTMSLNFGKGFDKTDSLHGALCSLKLVTKKKGDFVYVGPTKDLNGLTYTGMDAFASIDKKLLDLLNKDIVLYGKRLVKDG